MKHGIERQDKPAPKQGEALTQDDKLNTQAFIALVKACVENAVLSGGGVDEVINIVGDLTPEQIALLSAANAQTEASAQRSMMDEFLEASMQSKLQVAVLRLITALTSRASRF